ncbi:hypothetical protein HMPREF0020_02610 [Acinetobacter baumannii 6013113]|nr:hypothetical protein HMPREF0020_02610 [Acinetobacter baumannii 6013113]
MIPQKARFIAGLFYYILFLLKVCIRRRVYAQNMHIFKKQK